MSSSPSTWMPIYWGDYLKCTMHLSTEEHGAYLLLIAYYWQNGGKIKNDEKIIKNVCKISSKKLQNVLSFFEEKDGFLIHSRIDDELAEAVEHKEKQRNRTRAATEARLLASQRDVDVTTDVTFSPSPSPSPMKEIDMFSLQGETKTSSGEKKYKPEFESFWKEYPKTRIGNKDSAYNAWVKATKRSTEKEIMDGLQAYIGSDEVTRGFAKGAAAWLNDDRWKSDYTRKQYSSKPEQRYTETKKNVVTL
jgi:uncharacterized protein YdaU (DUF1376 family)